MHVLSCSFSSSLADSTEVAPAVGSKRKARLCRSQKNTSDALPLAPCALTPSTQDEQPSPSVVIPNTQVEQPSPPAIVPGTLIVFYKHVHIMRNEMYSIFLHRYYY